MTLRHFRPPATVVNRSQSVWQHLYQEAEKAIARKDYKHALKQFRYLLDHFPHHYEQHELLFKCGIAAEKSGDRELAKKYMTHSFKIKPTEQKLKYLTKLE